MTDQLLKIYEAIENPREASIRVVRNALATRRMKCVVDLQNHEGVWQSCDGILQTLRATRHSRATKFIEFYSTTLTLGQAAPCELTHSSGWY